MDGGVLRENRDAALALEIGVVHRPFGDPLVRPKRPALMQQRVNERRLAVIDVRDDRDVPPERVGDIRRGGSGRTVLFLQSHPCSIPAAA